MSTQIDLGPVLSIPKGDWNADTTYERLNMVRHNSASWICNVATSKGIEPTEDSTDWYLQVKDTSSVTSVNGMKGDVVIELTETETPPANDNSNRIATTAWVTDKLGDVDLSGIKEDTILAAQNASSLEVGTGELTSAELAAIIANSDSTLRALIAEEVAKLLPRDGGSCGPLTVITDIAKGSLELTEIPSSNQGARIALGCAEKENVVIDRWNNDLRFFGAASKKIVAFDPQTGILSCPYGVNGAATAISGIHVVRADKGFTVPAGGTWFVFSVTDVANLGMIQQTVEVAGGTYLNWNWYNGTVGYTAVMIRKAI